MVEVDGNQIFAADAAGDVCEFCHVSWLLLYDAAGRGFEGCDCSVSVTGHRFYSSSPVLLVVLAYWVSVIRHWSAHCFTVCLVTPNRWAAVA